MAGTTPPSWKQVFDVAERTIGTRINEFAKSENYAILMGLAVRAQREVSTRSERLSRQLLHLANLPAGSDVNRLLAQIGKLEREVRDLRNQLDDVELAPPVRLAARSASAARSSTARSSTARSSTARSSTATTRSAGTDKRKVTSNGVVRQSSRRARQDPA